MCQRSYIWNPATCSCKNGNYLGSIIDDSVITCDEIINAADSVLTNVISTVSKNFYNKKVRYKMYCYIMHVVLLVIILLFMIAMICYHYAKHRSKQKNRKTNNIKYYELKNVNVKNRTCYHFDNVIKFKDFDLDNILLNKQSYENILVNSISNKTLIGANPSRFRFNKIDGFIRVYDGTRYWIIWLWKA